MCLNTDLPKEGSGGVSPKELSSSASAASISSSSSSDDGFTTTPTAMARQAIRPPSLQDKEQETLWQSICLSIVVMLNTVFYLAPICFTILACLFYYGGIVVQTILLAYALFILVDRTPVRGGDSWLSYETIEWVRTWPTFWSSTAYFPAILHKTQDLEATPAQPYLFSYHPHGVIGMGVNCTLNTNCAGFRETFPGIRRWGVTLREVFYFPILREYGIASGYISADKQALRGKLEQGDSIVLLTGGAAEALYAQPGRFTLYLKKRMGFIKLAMETGAAIVPCLGFGENDAYHTFVPDATKDKFLMRVLLGIRKTIRFSTPMLKSPFPRRKPIHVVVGAPVKFDTASNKTVEECHAQYVAALTKLYHEHKAKYGHQDIPLEII